MSEFKEGDRVKIIGDHPNAGCITTIIYISGHSTLGAWAAVETAGLKNKKNDAPFLTQLEKVGDMKYQVGDKFFRDEYGTDRTEEILAVVEYDGTTYYITVDEEDTVEVTSEDTLDGYRKEGDVQELTLEQIAKKLNIPVKNLRIKD